MVSVFDTYLRKLRETPIDEQTEHTGRAALEALLNDFAAKSGRNRATVQHEPKRAAAKGAPDFKVILGYIYAVLHALSFRNRYAEFLRADFPRMPFRAKA